ncbi:MAG: nicotinate (nicotinamide) nucleotide adenylyltransferase [Acidobacteriota bacterium]|nr:MAG: nicotinate (nicotinamide) nucleotide adenylyltransferase [Acidobacteriota bacterium]
MRTGVYGGTFDPIHNGHFRIAEALIEAFGLDRMLLVPAYVPPHKRGQRISSAYHRMAMLALATAASERIFVSTIELDAPSRPYTIETLGRLQGEYPGSRLFFVMGSDSFRDVVMWRDYERILTEYSVIVSVRPGADPEGTAHLPESLRQRVVDLRGGRQPESLSIERIYLTDYVCVDVSSTAIREMVSRGQDAKSLMPPAVAGYIEKYELYR